MKKTKLTALALAALITFGGMANSAFAATVPSATVNTYSTDKVASPISNENFVKSLNGITEQEKALLLKSYNEIDKIGEQINAIYGDKKELNASDQKKVDSLSNQIDELRKKISNIESKISNSEKIEVDGDKMASLSSNENFVKSLSGITEQEKALLLSTYNEIDKIGEQINAICGDKKELNASEQKKVDSLSNQIDELCKKVSNIESKIPNIEKIDVDGDKVASPISNENFIKSLNGITEQEKALLLESYNEIDKIAKQINAIWGGKKELNASEQKKVDSLSKQLDELCKKARNIESKVSDSEKIFGSDSNQEIVEINN